MVILPKRNEIESRLKEEMPEILEVSGTEKIASFLSKYAGRKLDPSGVAMAVFFAITQAFGPDGVKIAHVVSKINGSKIINVIVEDPEIAQEAKEFFEKMISG